MQDINKLDYQETTLERLNSHIDLSIDNLWFNLDSLDNKLVAALLTSVLFMIYGLTTRTPSLISAILLSFIISSVVFNAVGILYPRPKSALAHRRFYFDDFNDVSVDELNEQILRNNLKLAENLDLCLENKTLNLWLSLITLCVSLLLSCFN